MKPIFFAVIGGIVAAVVAVAVAGSSMMAPNSGMNSALEEESPSVPQMEMPEQPLEDNPRVVEPNDDSSGFEADDNPIIIEDQDQVEPESPSSVVGSGQASADAIYEYHVEPREQAFGLLVPAGWNIESHAGPSPYGALKGYFLAQSPDQLKFIGFQIPTQESYVMPNEYLMLDGTVTHDEEGPSSSQPGISHYYYRTAHDYVNDLLIPGLEQVLSTDVQIVAEMPIASGQGSDAGFFELAYENNGVDTIMQILVRTYTGILTPDGKIYSWNVDLNTVAAPADEINEFAEVGWTSLGSMRANPQFVQRYIQGVADATSTFSSNSDAFFDALHSIQQSQSGLDSRFQGFSEATLGIQTAYDPSGNPHIVSLSHNNWFLGANSGRTYGSDTSDAPAAPETLIPLQVRN